MQIEARRICAGYAKDDVLHEVSMRAGSGRVLAIIGPNGCGKSTLLRVLCGLLRPRTGQVLVDERDIANLDGRERARRMAFLPQHPTAPNALSCRDLVMLGRTPHLGAYGTPSQRDHEAVQQSLARVGALEMADNPAHQLSGGQRQRVFLARALAQEAPMLLLDEPIAHLDLKFQFQILKLVRDLSRQSESSKNESASTCKGVIVVLHHINLAASIADDMMLMSEGRVVAAGSPQDVMQRDLLEEVFEVPLSVSAHPLSGRPQAQGRWDFDAPL